MGDNSTITVTICDRAENHVGMQQLGTYADSGFSLTDLFNLRDKFQQMGMTTELLDLNYPIEDLNIYPDDEAYILIIRGGVNSVIQPDYDVDDLFEEQKNLTWDKKAKMYGRVVNKFARHNLCYAYQSQEPDYENGRGRVIHFDDVPILKELKNVISEMLDLGKDELVAEGNYYYDVSKCGISYHGDGERVRVIGVRLGASMPLVYQWFFNGEPIGIKISLEFHHGDIYIMSSKAVGTDWKKKNSYTLRHAAGAPKFLQIKN